LILCGHKAQFVLGGSNGYGIVFSFSK
jgi:hypothetical protein